MIVVNKKGRLEERGHPLYFFWKINLKDARERVLSPWVVICPVRSGKAPETDYLCGLEREFKCSRARPGFIRRTGFRASGQRRPAGESAQGPVNEDVGLEGWVDHDKSLRLVGLDEASGRAAQFGADVRGKLGLHQQIGSSILYQAKIGASGTAQAG